MEIKKKTELYLSVYLGFFDRVRVRFTTNQFSESEEVSMSIRVRVMVRVTINWSKEIKYGKIGLREVGECKK